MTQAGQSDIPIRQIGDDSDSDSETSTSSSLSPSLKDRWYEVHDRLTDWWRSIRPQVRFGVSGDPDPTPISVDSILLADGKVAIDRNLLVDVELVLRGLRTSSKDFIIGVENTATARAKKKSALTQAAQEAEAKYLAALREQLDRSEGVISKLALINVDTYMTKVIES